jgi:photosystem II stability/assembly factor-like uncharacterized protein
MKFLSLLFIAILLFQISLLAQSGWVQQTSGTTENLNSVFFINENVGWAAGENGIIINTTDGGANWNPQNSNTTDDLYSVKFIDEDNGWIIKGHWSFPAPGMLRTSTGGQSWNTISTPGPSYFLTTDIGWSWLGQGIVLKTTDGGISWDTISTGLPQYILDRFYFSNENIGFMNLAGGVMQVFNKFYRTTDGGYNWNNLGWNTDEVWVEYCFVGDSLGWASKFSGEILKTEDAGENWFGQYYGGNLKEVFFINHYKGWVLRWDSYSTVDSILYTTDGGENWITQSVESSVLKSIYFIDEYNGWIVGDSGVVFHTTTGGVVSVEGETNSIPNNFNLTQNYPNPFNPSTKIKYSIPQTSNVLIKVFDILSNEIETLVNDEKQTGTYELTWNATNLPSGVYFYRLKAGDFVETKKMVLLR